MIPRKKCSKFTDERLNQIAEILNGIRVIKMFAWEDTFAEKVRKIRK